MGRFHASTRFVNAVLLEHSQVYPVAGCSWSLLAGRAEWRNCSTDRMPRKEKKDEYHVLYKMCFAGLGFDSVLATQV